MSGSPPQRAAPRYRALALAALVGHTLLSAAAAGCKASPAERARQLEALILAERLDRPLAPELRDRVIEGAPRAGAPTSFRLADLPGDGLVFLNFWATWCEPCVAEMPSLLDLAGRFPDDRLTVVAVSYDDRWDVIDRFFARALGRPPGRVVLARDPATDEAAMMRTAFGTRKLPETYLIRSGYVVSRIVNGRSWEDPIIVEYLETLLERPQ